MQLADNLICFRHFASLNWGKTAVLPRSVTRLCCDPNCCSYRRVHTAWASIKKLCALLIMLRRRTESGERECVFFFCVSMQERAKEWVRMMAEERERAGRGLAINDMNIPPPLYFFPAPFSIQGSHLHAPLRTLKCNFLPAITWQQ